MLADKFAIVLAAAALGTPAPPAPWNPTGHRIVSFLAWDALHETTRVELAKLLRAHPRFEDDLQVGLRPGTEGTAAIRHAFALASCWPDVVRSVSHPMHKVANHPRWHYVDLPFVVGEQPVPAAATNEADGPGNALEAITKNLADLANQQLPANERAIALCWVVHLIEDLHQPLHACSLYSEKFPQGDHGGNSFFVARSVRDTSGTNLHSLWDALLGNYELPELDACVAAGMAARGERSRAVLAEAPVVNDPAVWARESHELAVKYAYLEGKLLGVAADSADANKAPPLPNGYLAAAEQVAMQQAATAAHRLADALDRIFDPK